MKVVSDSGPLIHLSRIKKLELLNNFFSEVYIPEAVYEELTSQDEALPGAKKTKEYGWIKKKSVDKQTAKEFLMDYLDEGESEAILLAKDMDADLLLIDDLAGRNTARTHEINVMGTLGILDRAHEEEKIEGFKPLIDELQDKGFWMNDDLYEKLIQD